MSATITRVARRILVNQSYSMQRMTGQQRYATEISKRLLADPRFAAITPRGFWAGSAIRVWAWLQFVMPFRAWRSPTLSMTSRAPLVLPRQILVVHDLFVLTNPEWFSKKYVLTHAPLLRAQMKRAAGIVAVSTPVAAQLARYTSAPVVVAPNAPSDVFLDGAASEEFENSVLASRNLTRGSYFLAVGSLDPRKNLPMLARAYATLDDSERAESPLVVVGGGAAIYRQQDIDWPSGTVDAGYVSDEELRALYRGSRAVVFVSLAEGFGLPLVEAAASGAPSLVVSDIPVFRWICGDDAIYADATSPDSIGAALRRTLTDPPAISIDLERFRWDDSAKVVADLCLAIEQEAE
jgi:glycosyltransferase involved in cell wall biosynthesis